MAGRKERGAIGRGLRELEAMFTQARLLALDLSVSHRVGTGPTCICIHGLYASAGVFRPLRAALEERLDCGSHSFSYPPGPGIVSLSGRLGELIRNVSQPGPIVLLGHSLGGLVACHYVSQPEADRRVAATISLAAPFRGSRRSHLVPGDAGRDVHLGAGILQALAAGRGRPARLPHLSILAGEDRMIEPGAYPEFGEQLLVPRVGHNGILFHPDAIDAVVRRVQRVQGDSE